MVLPAAEDPLDYVFFADILKHGDPGKWKYLEHKPGSPSIAKSSRVIPGTNKLKVMELFEDEFGVIIELHYFRCDDGKVENVTVHS